MFASVVEEGLVLRMLEPRHAKALFDLVNRNREHLNPWFPWVEETKTAEDQNIFIRESLEKFARGDGFVLGIWLDDELAGFIGLSYIIQLFRCTEIAYWLGADYEGRGVMTKACRHLCGYLFTELNLNRVEIRCAETNAKSRAIPERLGFVLEGRLRQLGYTRAGLVDYLIYSLLREEWPV